MKTLKPVNGGVPVRVKDDEAGRRMKSGSWVFCKKSEWKAQVRDKGDEASKAKAEEAAAKAKAEAEERKARKKQVEKDLAYKTKKDK